jgi:hypothetical protein
MYAFRSMSRSSSLIRIVRTLLAVFVRASLPSRPAPADWRSTLAAVRVVFTAYLLLIAVCLAFYIAIGFINP